MNPDPKYKHDCLDCSFIGRDTDDSGYEIDIHICCNTTGISRNSIIGRYGDSGYEYQSYPAFISKIDLSLVPKWVTRGFDRARIKGIIK